MTGASFPMVSASVGVIPRKRIDKYDIVCPLAQGGMAAIYLGALSGPADFQKLVAVKIIHPHLAKEGAFAEMFLDEARLAAMIQHPNVAQVHTTGTDDGLPYMVVELVLGQDLRTLTRKISEVGAHLPQYVAAHILSQVCRGLHAAHEIRDAAGSPMGLVHRDVSLRNILISYDGHVKLIDFGVAWAKNRLSKTRVGTMKGKVAFMAPEQIRGEPLDRRTDVFSAGVVLYQLLTGQHPFPAQTESERMRKIISVAPKPVCEVAKKADPRLAGIVERALSKNPKGRYAEASIMADRLDEACRSIKATGLGRQLEQLMNGLFAKERAEHEKRVREFHKERRRLHGGVAFEAASRDDETIQVEGSADGSRSYEMTAVTSPSRSIWSESFLGRNGLLGLVMAGVVLGVVGLFALDYERPDSFDAEPTATQKKAAEKRVLHPVDEPKRLGSSPDGHLEAADPSKKASRSELVIDLEPRDAAVFLDGVRIDVSKRIVLPDGKEHVLVVRAPGYKESRRRFRLESDMRIEMKLKPVRKRADSKRPKKKTSRHGATQKKQHDLLKNPY